MILANGNFDDCLPGEAIESEAEAAMGLEHGKEGGIFPATWRAFNTRRFCHIWRHGQANSPKQLNALRDRIHELQLFVAETALLGNRFDAIRRLLQTAVCCINPKSLPPLLRGNVRASWCKRMQIFLGHLDSFNQSFNAKIQTLDKSGLKVARWWINPARESPSCQAKRYKLQGIVMAQPHAIRILSVEVNLFQFIIKMLLILSPGRRSSGNPKTSMRVQRVCN